MKSGHGVGLDHTIRRADLYRVLAHRRRRYALHHLKAVEQATTLGELAEQVAAWENDKSVAEVTSSERKRAYTGLQQSHLRMMGEAGVVTYDKDRGIVEPTTALKNVDVYFDIVHDGDIPWHEYYLAVSGVWAALVVAIWLGTWPLTLFSELGWLLFATVTLFASAFAHTLHNRRNRIGVDGPPPELEEDDITPTDETHDAR